MELTPIISYTSTTPCWNVKRLVEVLDCFVFFCKINVLVNYEYECVVDNNYEETWFTSLYLLYSVWMNILVSTTAAGVETCRSKK